MNIPAKQPCNLVWQEFLSPDEIVRWVVDREKPSKTQLVGCISHPGVYRFIFPEAIDGASSHTPCYVGEAGDLGDRIPVYFCALTDKEKRDKSGNLILDSEWKVRGAIQNAIRDSPGKCSLQLLAIEGPVIFCGVILSQTDLDNPFARRFLENWAILHSINEGFSPLNCGISQGAKDFFRMQTAASKKAGNI